MGHIIDALKVLFTRTPSEGKYFPVTKSNGELQGQISQAELVAAVKEALPGILADQSTSFANILTKNASGALGTATIANMASVLGAAKNFIELTSSDNLDSCTNHNAIYVWGSTSNSPSNAPTDYGAMTVQNLHGMLIQKCTRISASVFELYYRQKENSWSSWRKISYNIPDFYKDYASLAALATGLGVNTYTLPSTTNTIDISIGYGLIYVGDPNTGGYGLFSVSFGSVRKIASVYDEHYTVTRKDSATVTLTYPDTHNSEVFIKLLKF